MNSNSTTISKTIKLNNGIEMPRVGLGTHEIPDLANVIYESIKLGLKMIDTAFRYGNEKEVGEGINKAIKDGIVERKDLFIVTKLAYFQRHKPHEAILNQLKILNLEYIDLYLDHWGMSVNVVDGEVIKTPTHVLWKNMEDLVKKGYTKSIGVSNYNVQLLMDLLSYCEIKPVVNQVEFHPYLATENLLKYCEKNEVYFMAYNSICRGTYVDQYHGSVKLNLLEEEIVKEMSKKYEKTVGQIVLNWALSQNNIVIPSTSKPSRIKENLETLDFRMSKEDVEKVSKLNNGYRFGGSLNWFDFDTFA